MARGTQLQDLVSMLRAEAGHSTLVSAGIDNLPALHTKLRRVQTMLDDDYDWPFMQVKPFKNLVAGQRYYDLPTEMRLEDIDNVALWYNGQPRRILRGIGPREYSRLNPVLNERGSPVENWDVVSTGDTSGTGEILEQIEVWPIPNVNGMQLQWFGKRKLRPLVADTDVCDMDDLCIVLVAAAEILASQESKEADAVARAAAKRIGQMKGRTKGGSQRISMGSSTAPSRLGSPVIRVR